MESLEPRLLLSGSDLWVSATVAPGSAVLSSPITLSWTVQNRGDEPTASGWGWTDRVYLSQDDQVDINHHGGGDAVVAEFQYEGEPLAAGASYTVPDQAVTLPGGFSGTAWLLFVSDAWDFEVEGDEANNVRAVEINVTAPNVDLRITSATVPASAAASGQIDLSWTVRNTGTAAAAAQWTDTVYLSEDEVLDPWGDYWLGDVLRETPLAGGAQYTATQSIALPNMTPGAYYVIIAADAGFANAQAETDEDNNLRVAPITLVASSVDLRISAEAPAPATQGEQLTLEWTVTNAGSAPAAASWTDSVYVSTDDVLDTNDDYYFGSAWRESGAPLAAGAGYTGAATGFLPSDLSGDLYLLFTTDTWDNQAESNNDNNVFAVPYHVNPVSIDLAVTAVTAAPNARPGEWITIGWDVANLGDVAAESDWSDYVYLSTDTTVDDGDVALGQFNMAWQSPLASGASYSQSNWFTIPAETAAGDYYVLVHTDGGGYSWQMESDEANNVLAAPLRVGTPDLQVTAGTVPPSGDSSNPIEVSWTATNTGDGLAAGFWYDYIYLSDDDVLDGGDVQLGFFRIEEPSPVGVGGSYTRTETVNIPLGASGSRILVAADQAGHLTETDETNNTWAAPITLGSPNLIVADADAPDAAVVGQTISVTYTVRNDGTAPATVGYSDRFYLSADDQWDAGDALLGTAEPWDYLPVAAGGGSYSMAVELPILAGASGGHYLLVVADGSGSVAESDETDNVRALALSLTAPDLTITASGPASAGWGDAVSLSWTVTNAGDGPAAAEWYDRVFLSDDTVLDGDDVAIHSRWAADASPLAAGASYEVTDTVTLPAGRSGTQYLLFVADAYGQQGEADESNNAAVVQISLDGADLAISDTDAAVATASWGETVGLWWTVANIGNRPATSSWYDYVYLSDDGVLDDGDLYVTRFANGGPSPLAIGDSYTSSVSVTIPAGRLGQQYLLVAANGATWSMERQAETDPDNNVQAVPVVLRAANLTISQPEAPAQTGWGQSVTLGWTVTNTGDGTAVASWRDIAYLSADDQLDGSDTFLGNAWADDASPLAAGDAYTVTRTFTVPAGFRGTGYVLIRADGGSDQLESDEQDNLAAVAITVSAPDVTVSAAEAVEAAVWGEMISATWTVTNVGDGAAASPWYDYIVLSADAVLDDSDPTAGAAWAGPYVPLAAGASYTIGRDFTIPTSFQGDGYILFVADGNRSLGESDETNNVTAVPIRLSAPDLELAGLSAPDAVVFGGAFDVSWRVSNISASDADRGWSDEIWLSDDAAWDAGDTLLHSDWVAEGLAAGAEYVKTRAVTIRQGESGTKYLLVVTNRTAVQGETDTANNIAVKPIALGAPDLAISEPAAPAAASWGQPFEVSWTVANTGDVAAPAAWYDDVYLSADTTWDFSDRILASFSSWDLVPLGPGESYTVTRTATIPSYAGMTGGLYLLFRTDIYGAQNETDETNNIVAVPITVGSPDLEISAASAAPAAVFGQAVDLSWTVSNIGGNATAGTWRDRVYLSGDDQFDCDDLELAAFTAREGDLPLAGGGSYTRTESIELPLRSTLAAGAYYLIVVTDSGGEVAELSEDNNRAATAAVNVALPDLPDLQVSLVTAPAAGHSGQAVELTWTVANSGSGDATGSWSDRVYLSADGAVGADQHIASFAYAGTIASGSSLVRTQTVVLPSDLQGQAWFVVAANANGGLFEHTATDNNAAVAAAPIDVTLHAPNLQVAAVQPPQTASSGQAVTVEYTVTNAGNAATSAPIWYDRVYLSLDAAWHAGDTLLATVPNGSYLNPGDSYANTVTAVVPEGVEGTYYFIVVTDTYNQVTELGHENDNAGAGAATAIELTPPPDLVVASARTIGTAFSGQPVPVQWTVINDGASPTQGSTWTDRLYLSADNQLDPHADLLLGTVNHSGRLLPGQSYAVSTTATLPVDATGQWHLLVLVDAYGSVFEHTYEVNNVHDLPVQVTLTPPPDLEVTAVAAPAEAIAGHGLELTWTVVNRGSTATAASRWADGVYLSADGVFDPEEDLRLGDVDRYGTLAPGQSYTRTASVTLPHDLAGTFTVFVRADRADAVFELDNDNNALAAAAATTVLLRAADLAVTALAVPADARAGQGVYVDWTVANQGAGATTAPYWYDRLVLSADTVLSGNDVVLGTYRHDGALAAGESYGRNDLVVLPATWAGDAYILAVADNHAYVVEVGGEDNNATASTAIAVAQRAVDLVVTSVSAPAAVQSGASLPVAWSVRNNGEGYPVDAWYDRVYLSPDGVLGGEDDILLGSLRHTGGLPAGAQYDASLNASLGADLSGAWYVVVVTDAFGGVAEGDGEDNNATASDEPITVTLTPSPDLVVAAIAAPATVVSGQTAELAWTVANTGDGPAAGSRYDAVYLSRDLVLDTATDSYLGYAWRNTTIPAGSSEQVAGSFRIPAGRSGPYYVFVVADSRGSIAERGGEANNVGYTGSPVQVNVAPPADLVAGQITIPAGVTPGQNVSLTYTVSNGGLNTAVGAWFDALYLSADAVWDVGDRLIGRYQHSGDVAAGGTYTHTLVAPLPGVNPGEYHVLLRSDIRNNVEESSEANNFSASLDRAEIDAERLDLADPAAGTLAQGFSRYYKVDVPAGQTLLVRLDSQAADAANRLFVAFGRVPTASDFDVASAGAFLADVEAVVPTTQAGTYYIMATAELVVGAEQTYDLTAEIVPYSVRQALPAAVGDTGPVTLKLRGARLTADTTFGLVGPDGVVIAPTAVRVVDPSLAYATFDLAGAALGAYAVRATDVGAALNHVLADGVTVIDGAGARIDARFEGPTSVRFGSSYQVGLYYGNLGDADGIAPLIWLANNTGTPMGVTPDGLDDGPGMMFLGAGDEGPAGVLRPGELYTIPIYFHASTETIDYNSVSIYHADDVGAIDWDFFEPGVRRTDMSDELWAAVWRQVQDNIGDTMGSLVRTLAANATLLPASMGSPRHVGLLLQMEVERALAQVTSSLAGTCVRGSLDVQVAGRTLYAIRREGSEVFHAVAMNDGSFYLHGLPAGTYDFAFEGAVVDAADQGQVVAADQHRTGVRLSLIAGSQVGGVVRAAVGGAAIGGATVTLRSPAGLALAVRTDAAGRYRFDGLDAGTYRLTVAAPGRATTTTALEVAARGQSLAADVLLAAESTLRGSLVYAAGPADTLLRVTAVSRTDAGSVFTLETDLAAFELGRLPADTYDVFLSRSGYRSVELEGVAVGSDQSVDLGEIAMDAAAALSGYVTSHVGGVTPGMVDLTLWEDDEIRGHAVPAADGYFYFTDFGPGTYRIEVNEGTTHVSSSITLSVTDGQSVADLVLGVYGGAVVTGVIRDATTSQPVPGMSVTLIGADGEALAAVSDGQGVYRFERLATGTVVVGLAPADEGLRRTLVLDDPDGQEYTADFAYDYASAARVSGVLRDADGQAVAYGRAALFQSGRFVVGAVADELGRYEFVVFQPGSYDLVATAGDVTFASVDGLAVGEGAHVTQDLQGGRGSLSVTVNNLPAGTGAVVALYHRLAGRWSLVHRGGIAAGSPLLTLSGCAAGDYRVQVSTEEGLGGVADASLPTGGAVSAAVNLQPFASLDGIIRHNGQPLAGANVVLAMRDGSGMALTTVTDTRGYYEFPLIDPVASHDLIIVAEGMAARTETMDPLGAGAHGQDFSLTASTSALNGRVVDGADRPIAGAMVSVTDAAGRTIGSALTAADGRFSIATAVGANLTVDVAAPCYRGETLTGAAIPAGTVQDLGDVTLTLVGESRFTGDLALLADDPLPAPPSRDGWVYHSPGKPGWMDALFDEEPRLIYTPLAELEALNPPANCPLAASAKALLIEAWMVQDSSYQWVQENQEVLDALVKAEAGSAVLNGLAFSGRIASIVLNVNALRGAVQAIRLIPAASASQTMFQEVAEHHQAIREAIEGVVQGLTGALSDVQGISSSPTPESALSQFANVMTVVNDCMGLLAGAVSTLATLLKDKAGAALVGGAGAAFGLLNDLIGIKDTLQYGYDAFVEGYHGLQNIVAAKERLTDAKVLYRKNVAAYQSAWSYYLGTLSWCRRDDGDGDDEGDDAPPPPEPPAPPPPPPGHRYYRPGVVRSKDPNDILGPSGRGEENFVWADTAFGYTIRFENSASATAAARTVVITQQLDADLDWRTFRIDDLGWGDFRLELDASMPILARRVDLTDSAGYLVDVTAYIDVLTGVATWRLETIDPATGEPPLDPSVGFLPPNNEDGVGDGFVTYSIRPRSDAPTGTRIDAEATIVFDTEAPLDTPPIFHTLDVDAPASSVQVLTGATGEAHFDVRWSGSDGQGAGIASYDLYVSVDDGPFQPWLIGTTLTEAVYRGLPGHRYAFYSVARDGVDNVEPHALTFDARTYTTTGAVPPTAADDQATVSEDAPAAVIDVLANDTTDPEIGQAFTVTAVTQGAHGTVTVAGDGLSVSYQPAADFYGTDTFTYTITDEDGLTDTATVTVTVANMPDPPTAVDDAATVAEDSPAAAIDVLANDTTSPDPNQTVAVTAVTQPAHGTVAITGGGTGLTYQPAADYYGIDTFTYTITDADGLTATATVTVTVANTPDAPTADDDAATVAEDAAATAIDVLANDTAGADPDTTLTITAVAQPAHGTVAITGGGTGLTYRPSADYYGDDSFTYTVTDADGLSATATVNVTVTPQPDAPHAGGDVATIDEDAAATMLDVLANDSSLPDAPQDFTITAVTQGAHGTVTLAGDGLSVSYQPAADFYGTDTFTYTITDEDGLTDTATVTVTVANTPDAPTADDDAATVAEDAAAAAIDVLGNDTAGADPDQTLTITAVTQGAHGTVAITGGRTGLTYQPAADYYGEDSFTYTVTDEDGLTATATVTVTVTNTPDAPAAADDEFVVAEDAEATAVDVLANDTTAPDPDQAMTITAVAQPAHGIVAITGGGTGLTYQPAADYYGEDSFTYTITDEDGLTATATVNVTVTPQPDAPSAADDVATVDEDSAATTLEVLANDTSLPDAPQNFTITAVTQGAHGTVTIAGDSLSVSYQPAADFYGTDTFTYTITDEDGLTDTATVTVTVANTPDAPTADNDAATVAEDAAAAAIDVLGNDTAGTDPDQTLTITAVTQGTHGAVAITGDGTGLTYQPAADYHGEDSFTYTVTDEDGLTATATVTVTVTNTPDAPAADDDELVLAEDAEATAVDVLANDTTAPDPDQAMTITAVTQPAHGAVAITGGGTGLTYQPAADYYGEDSFTYTITDEDGLTATATVTVTVTPQPDAPSVADDSLVVPADAPATAVDVLANDTTQPDGVQAMTVTAVTQGAHGLVEIEAGGARVTYQPQTGWFGDDSFTYTVTDEDGLTATASVAVTVLPPVGPDLAVALLDKALPEAIVSGERLVGRVRVVISNSGNEPVPAGRRADVEVWAVSGPTEILVGALPNLAIGGLGVGAVKAAAIAVFQPDSLPSGQYRLEVRIAPTEPMAELSVANNEALVQNELISAEPFIDLEPAIDSVAVAAPATGGDRLAVRLRVTNRGNVPVSQRGDIELWAVDGPSETLLVRLPRQLLSMGAGQVRVFAAVATVPATLPAGTYDLQVRIDTAGEVDESDEANNTAVSPAALNVQNPDLAVGFARSTLPATVVPGDRGVVFAEIGNLAAVRASGAVDLQLWASPDGVVGDDDDVLLASLANQRIVLPAGGSRLYPLRATVPGTMAPGEYQLVLVVDAADAVTEADETNNQALAADPLAMKLRFGTFDGRRNVALRLTDSAGVQSTFTVRGNGYGEVAGGDFDTVELFETDLSSAVRVVSRGAAGLGDVTVHGSLGSFTAPGIALRGDVGVSGTIRSLALGDLAGGNTVAIGPAEAGSNVAAVLSFAQVSDAALTSQTPIRTLTAAAWLDSGGAHETVTAPQINLLRIAGDRRRGLSGDFEADLVLDGGQPVSLAAVQIDGWLRNSTVRTDGSIGVFQAGGFDHANVLAGLRDDLIGLPQDAADFDALAQAQIRVLTARGIRGDTGPAFIDSNVAAWTIGKAVLQRVDTAGDEGPFGLAARGYASVLWTDLAGRRTLVRQSQAAQVEDFLIRVI